ncbi:MAG: class B sortase [Ruminococcaceae bacterium]|nr:class B sortase [Oscillospiraceae bacterium]
MKFKDFINRFSPRDEEETEGINENSEFELSLAETESICENGRFLNSVDQLSEEDIELPPNMAPKKKNGDLPRRILLGVFSLTFAVSCLLLVKDALSKQKAAEIYGKLEEEFFSAGFDFNISDGNEADNGAVKRLLADSENNALPTWSESMDRENSANDESRKEYNEELEKMRAGLASLARINPDIYGWITVEGTQINYPLVQGEDNDFYLNHAYTGEFLPEGSIFVDYRNDPAIDENLNTVFYGHNLRTGGMFHDVTKFARDDYMADNLIYVYTNDGVFIYEPFSFYESRFDYNYFKTQFATEEEFLTFAEEIKGNTAATEKDIVFGENDRLLTLSTCTNGYYTQRYALHARLIQVISD